jgi:hypothetical protein
LQVFDLGENRPDQVLKAIWKNFDKKEDSDGRVRALRERLRVVVAGGDGTVGWTLQVRCDSSGTAWHVRRDNAPLQACIVLYKPLSVRQGQDLTMPAKITSPPFWVRISAQMTSIICVVPKAEVSRT